jgi:hypothetical protein
MICSRLKVYQNESDIKSNFKDAMPVLQNSKYSVGYSAWSNRYTIPPGDQKIILSVYTDEITPEYVEYRNNVLNEIKKCTLELEYRDIYGQHIETLRRDKWETGS